MSIWDLIGAIVGSVFVLTLFNGGVSMIAAGDEEGAPAVIVAMILIVWPLYCIGRLAGAHL